ncbi:20-hydroxyecdysone protein [Musca vetustissima]|uniref:20-hydroxyecdysone protein n=1 Tax=Musca vetustissima TaxID=27455 RepID=UPI002AB6E6A6|nr:20-hydroxyecdysone protein [Musca vetustissima]
MRFSFAVVGIFFLAAVCQAAVVPRRYRSTEEILVPVTVIQDGEEIKDVSNEANLQSQVKSVATEVIAEEIAKAVDEEQKLEAVEAVVEAQRRLDGDVVKEDAEEAVVKENSELLKTLQTEEKTSVVVIDEKKGDDVAVQPELKSEEVKPLSGEKPVEDEQAAQQFKALVKDDSSEEHVQTPVVSSDDEEGAPEATLRQATQATPGQTTQQNFVQQLIQSSPLGQFFNQITGQTQNTQQVANDETAPATPNPTIPSFLAPAISTVQNAAQSVVNTTQNAFQGLTNLASNLGTTFQNTLSSFGGQPPAQQQGASGDATTARPQGPLQQLVSTIMGNNNQQATPASGTQPQGPLQGLLNIFQGNNANNANNNTPQASTHSADTTATQPATQPETPDQTPTAGEEVAIAADDMNNEIRSSAEVDDSFEETNQPEELIVVQDDASQNHDNEH